MDQDVEEEEKGADRDGGVSDVESGPRIEKLPRQEAEPDFQEIGDGAVDDSVGEVSGGSAKKQREACGVETAGVALYDQQPGDQGDDQQRTHDEGDARGHA